MSATLVDSNILLDVIKNDATWKNWSLRQMMASADQGEVLVNTMIYAEVASGFAHDHDGTRGQTFQISDEIEVHDVQAFLQAFDEEFGLSGFSGIESADVIRSPEFAIRPGAENLLYRLD